MELGDKTLSNNIQACITITLGFRVQGLGFRVQGLTERRSCTALGLTGCFVAMDPGHSSIVYRNLSEGVCMLKSWS